MRAKELDKLVEHLQRRDTVRLVAGRENGATTLLDELEATLITLGFSVVRITGAPSPTEARFAAIRQALLAADRIPPQASQDEVRDILAVELSRTPNTVLLIDDAELLDIPSAQVLAPLFDRMKLAGVFVSVPFTQLTPEQRVVSRILRADARVDLNALTFEQVGVLAETLLDAPVSPAVTSEVFSMSSGITGVASEILRTARATGKIRRDGNRWTLSEGDLWNPHLEESIERLLAPIENTALRLLHALAFVGSLTAEDLHDFDPSSAESLTRSGLITTFKDPQGVSRVSPRPALIADYFRQRPFDLLSMAATDLLEGLAAKRVDGPPRVARPKLKLDAHVRHSDTAETHNAGLSRYLREENEQRLAVAAREWRRHHDTLRAIIYLETLLQSGRYVSTAVGVLERTPSDDASGPELLQLALHEHILQREASAPQTLHSLTLRRHHPGYAVALDAYEIYLRFCDEGRVASVEEWLQDPGDDPVGFCTTIAEYIRVMSGELLEQLAPSPPVDAPPFQHVVVEQSRLVLFIRQAVSNDELEDLLSDPLHLGPGEDPVPFLVNSYVRSQMLLGLGRVSEARHTLSQALSLGDFDLRYAVLYAAMLRWSAFLHFREGRADIAQSLLRESRDYAAVRGPMPGMRPEFGDALGVLLSGDRAAAGAAFLAEANTCYELSFFDAAWNTARFAFQLNPGEEALELIERLSREPSQAWITPLLEFARSAIRQDPSISIYVSRFRTLPELIAAADFLDDIGFAHRARGTEVDPEFAQAYAEARDTLHISREPLSRVTFRHSPLPVDNLTPREREIAPLTATLSNREIADRLTLSIRTVENHIARSMKKLGLTSRADLSAALAASAKPGSGAHQFRSHS